jgi:ABC-type multidrug transport system ATPase subunit/pSer/pThr/pTyr-binding forkhead associated (FHA) protein
MDAKRVACGPAALEVIVGPRRVVVAPTTRFVVGRGAGVDLALDHPRVSRQHLVLEPAPSGWTAVDRSRNGTFSGSDRVSALTITSPTTLLLGDVANGQPVELRPRGVGATSGEFPTIAGQGRSAAVPEAGRLSVTVGRLADNDVVLDDRLVSRHHARLDRTSHGWRLVDLGSANGTFVNGRRVDEAVVTGRDVIGIGHRLLQMCGDRLSPFLDAGSSNTFVVDDVSVTTAKGRTLLQSIGFTLPGKCLLAVVGPSGAGKSTLLHTLAGARPADRGTIRHADRDLYVDHAELRRRIALVPQDDVLHTQLTVRQTLTYAARLRFAADVDAAARRSRVEEVIAELGLTGQADQRISSLSGGQRKRTSVALELLTKPSLLFLDEPTSGLDPGLDRSVMHTLRELADDDRTVVVSTHNVDNIHLCDRVLVLAAGGELAFFGRPDEALRYFGKKDFADIFLMLGEQPGEYWARRFRRSPHHVIAALRRHRPRQLPRPSTARPSRPEWRRSLVQFGVLVHRYLAVIAADRAYAGFLAALPLVLSLLARAVPGSAGLSVHAALAGGDPQPRQLLLVLVLGAALMGAAASVRELVKERSVYRRERAVGLSLGAYVASKAVVLGGVTALQATLFTMLALLGREGPDEALVLTQGKLEVLVAVLAVALASMVAGLLISATIDNADRGMPILVLLIMVQLILCGGLFGVHDRPLLDQLAWLVPSRWGFSMTAATVGLADLSRAPSDPGWEHTAGTWFGSLAALLVTLVLPLGLTVLSLTRFDPRLGPARRNSRQELAG